MEKLTREQLQDAKKCEEIRCDDCSMKSICYDNNVFESERRLAQTALLLMDELEQERQKLKPAMEALHQAREKLIKFHDNRLEGDKLYIYAGRPDLKEIIDAINGLLAGSSDGQEAG